MTAVWIALLAVFIALIPAISLGIKKSNEAKAAKEKASSDDGGIAYLPAAASDSRDPGMHGHLKHADPHHADHGTDSDSSSGGDGGGGGSD